MLNPILPYLGDYSKDYQKYSWRSLQKQISQQRLTDAIASYDLSTSLEIIECIFPGVDPIEALRDWQFGGQSDD